MKICRDLQGVASENIPVAVAVGTFDGVHRGHQEVLARAKSWAAQMGGEAWALTFDPHPAKVLNPSRAPLLLTSTEHKLVLLEREGLAGVMLLTFTPELAALEPEAFLETLRAKWPAVRVIVSGPNWTFGRGGKGNVEFLRDWAQRHGIVVEVAEPVCWKGHPISSTRVRRTVQVGWLEEAAAMLGRPFSVLGLVRPGRQVGSRLGYPTANVDPRNEVLPPPGVYAVRVPFGERHLWGAAFLDDRIHSEAPAPIRPVEVHLLNYAGGHLYGRELEVMFIRYLRGVQRFPTDEALREQIGRDVASVAALSKRQDEGFPACSTWDSTTE